MRNRRVSASPQRGQGRFNQALLALTLCLGGVTLAASAQAAQADAPVRCERLTFQVALAPGQPANNQMAAWLCARGAIQHKTVQVLIHGATYDHNYWDFPFQPETYSY